MVRFVTALASLVLAACTPTLNWREASVDATGLKALMPCKPDTVERRLEVAPGRMLLVHATGCEAGAGSFVVLHANAQDGDPAALIAQWKAASLAGMHGQVSGESSANVPGATAMPPAAKLTAHGQRPDGRAMQSQALYFARGTQVFQAVIYADRVTGEMAEPFFTGLRFE